MVTASDCSKPEGNSSTEVQGLGSRINGLGFGVVLGKKGNLYEWIVVGFYSLVPY